MKHLVTARQFSSAAQLQMLFDEADRIAELYYRTWCRDLQLSQPVSSHIMATVFYQPSTRTRLSFETAMLQMGGQVISVPDANCSSITKGETLEDTVKTVSQFADIVVLRHPEVGAVARSARYCDTTLINAGDGYGEHPTQALLDLYTIYKEKGKIDDLSIAIVGDLLYGRTVHSLIYLLGLYKRVTVILCNPPSLQLPVDIQNYLWEDRGEHTLGFHSHPNVERAMYEKPDVVYMTRAQQPSYHYDMDFCLGHREMEILPESSIVLHPLPRQNEISPAMDYDPRMCYWKQVRNGIAVRKAIISQISHGRVAWE